MIVPSGWAGVDLGATLAKLVFGQGKTAVWARFDSADLSAVLSQLEVWAPQKIAATGGGAHSLPPSLSGVPIPRIDEFTAWAEGAPRVAREARLELPSSYLLVSLGTGTSVLEVLNGKARRVGGSALGGGTLLGLGRLLVQASTFAAIANLAQTGDRRKVDLLVSDIYRSGGIALPPDLNAASFGKLDSTRPEDLAHALMGLIGENVALIATALSRAAATSTVVYCGSTLEANPALEQILARTTEAFGNQALFLPGGAYCGAVGAAWRARG